jgi:hypothetical protein
LSLSGFGCEIKIRLGATALTAVPVFDPIFAMLLI